MRVLFVVGIADGDRVRVDADALRAGVALRGNAGVIEALRGPCESRGWDIAVLLLGQPGRPRLAGVDLLVNCICDASVQRRALAQLARVAARSRVPIVNHPWAVTGAARGAASRILAFQPQVRVPLTTRYEGGAAGLARHVEARGHRFPVLVRPVGAHGAQGLVRFDSPGALRDAQLPAAQCFVTDYVEYVSGDGLYRKYRYVYVDDVLYRRHLLIGPEWRVSDAVRPFMRRTAGLVVEEKEFLVTRGSWYEDLLLHQFRALRLDFGAVDFAVHGDGTLTIFEINPCFELMAPGALTPERAERWGYIAHSNDLIVQALVRMFERRAGRRS